MPGAPISRWTMAYFAASLAFLIAGLVLTGSGFGYPAADVEAPDTLVVVHLIAIGWLALLFCGALLQFVPVLAVEQPRFPKVAAPALVAIITGLLCLVAGFLALGGRLDVDPSLMAVGGVLLALGFGALILSFAATLLAQKKGDVSGRLVLIGLVALAATIALGAAFSFGLSGASEWPVLAELISFGVPYHAAFGILGWMTVTAVGVSYRMFAMFMLAPEIGAGRGRVLAYAAALVLLASALAAEYFFAPPATAIVLAGLALTGALTALYLRDLVKMYKARKRRQLELNSVVGLQSLVFLVAGVVLLVVGQSDMLAAPLGATGFYLLAMGWLTGLGLAQLYKIVPFLTWLEAYGAVMGRAPVPRVQDLVDESRAKKWFYVYHAAVSGGAASILLELPAGFQLMTWGQIAAVVALVAELVRARRLSYPPAETRLPAGAVRPHLLHADPK